MTLRLTNKYDNLICRKNFEGARADLLLVEGNHTVTISDTLSIYAVWRNEVLQEKFNE
jgi:hypothetical protein